MTQSVGPTLGQILRPNHQPEEYTTLGVVLKFFEEKAKDVAKTLGYTGFWLGQAIPDLPPEVKSFSGEMGAFKNFVSTTEVPKKVVETVESYGKLAGVIGVADRVGEAVKDAFKKTTGLISAVVDGIDFSSRFIAINTAVMTWLKGISSFATLGGSAVSGYEQIQNISNAQSHETSKTAFYVINLLRDASYAAVGAMGIVSFLTATPLVPWVLVACLTSGLACTIGGYFYEKLYDPEGKGKNLNPEAVIKNRLTTR